MFIKFVKALIGALFAFVLTSAHAETSASAQPQPAAAVYRIHGVVKATAPGAVTLAHEAVPELQWPAMTMPFALVSGLTPPPLKVDQAVEADVSLVDGRYVITAIRPRG